VGTSGNEWRFTGELQDSRVARGMYYLRARYYDPALGRFIGRDPFWGFVADSQSQNRYAYVCNSCPNHSDPSGLMRPGPGRPDEKVVCVTYVEVWDLWGGLDIHIGPLRIRAPSFKLFRFELTSLYYRRDRAEPYLFMSWADETHLGEGWHIDRSSLDFGPKEGGGAMASARFGAGGANPFGFWPAGFNTDVQLRQWIQDGEIVGSADAQHNPVLFPGIRTKSGTACGEWR
jgi:RHS repeat-associated protein